MLLKKTIPYLVALTLLVSSAFYIFAQPPSEKQQESTPAPTEIASEQVSHETGIFSQEEINKFSETFGNIIGKNLKSPGFAFDIDAIITGMHAGMAGKDAPLSESEYQEMSTIIQQHAFRQIAENNLREATAFMEANAKNDNIVEIAPGKLQYTIIEQGDGAVVAANGSPRIHYVGKYLNGAVFGSSLETGAPITLSLDHVIQGFSKGLIGMKEGEKRRLFIHPDMGYGTSGNLPPNSLLIFDIEVVQADSMNSNLNDDE